MDMAALDNVGVGTELEADTDDRPALLAERATLNFQTLIRLGTGPLRTRLMVIVQDCPWGRRERQLGASHVSSSDTI